MTTDRYITNQDYRRQKTALTRAVNSGDPLKVLAAVEKTLDEWAGKAWPDAWHRWRNALDDAFLSFARTDAFRADGETRDRFNAAATQLGF